MEGNIYPTWKGIWQPGRGLRRGNQSRRWHSNGRDEEIGSIEGGSKSVPLFNLHGRSVDLRFDSKEERDAWWSLLDLVVKKENGLLSTVPPCITPEDSTLDALLYGAAVGAHAVPKAIREQARHLREVGFSGEVL